MNVKTKMRLYTNAKQTGIIEIFGGDAPCKYGRKDGGFLARPDPKTGTKIGKNLAPITFSPLPSPSMTPINLANQFCRSLGRSIR